MIFVRLIVHLSFSFHYLFALDCCCDCWGKSCKFRSLFHAKSTKEFNHYGTTWEEKDGHDCKCNKSCYEEFGKDEDCDCLMVGGYQKKKVIQEDKCFKTQNHKSAVTHNIKDWYYNLNHLECKLEDDDTFVCDEGNKSLFFRFRYDYVKDGTPSEDPTICSTCPILTIQFHSSGRLGKEDEYTLWDDATEIALNNYIETVEYIDINHKDHLKLHDEYLPIKFNGRNQIHTHIMFSGPNKAQTFLSSDWKKPEIGFAPFIEHMNQLDKSIKKQNVVPTENLQSKKTKAFDMSLAKQNSLRDFGMENRIHRRRV